MYVYMYVCCVCYFTVLKTIIFLQCSSTMSAQAATGFLAVLFFLQLQLLPFSGAVLPPLTNNPAEAFHIARAAFTFFVPVVINWRFLSLSTNLEENPVPFDEFQHGEDFRPPNENVIYSISWLDVRQEPRVITVPPGIQERYYSVQIIDGYTHNIGIVSERTFPRPTQSGNFVVAGPGQCDPPSSCTCDGINEEDIFYSESVFVLVLIRIQAFSRLDIENVTDIQEGFGIKKLGLFCGVMSPAALPLPLFFFVPLQASLTTDYFGFVNQLLPLMFRGAHPTEVRLFRDFAKIGIIPGAQVYPPSGLSPRVVQAIRLGIVTGFTDVNIDLLRPSTGTFRGGWILVIDPPQFGNRSVMQGRYLTRAAAARGGLYGLDPEEAFYPNTRRTLHGRPLNGAGNTPYYMMFDQSNLPPVFGDDPLEDSDTARRGFWSITMHTRFNFSISFVPNPINRFSIGSRELRTFCRNQDGSFPIIMQAEPPTEPAFLRNWLPAPDGFFVLLARLYAPRPRAIAAPYLPPPVRLGFPLEVPTECFPPLSQEP